MKKPHIIILTLIGAAVVIGVVFSMVSPDNDPVEYTIETVRKAKNAAEEKQEKEEREITEEEAAELETQGGVFYEVPFAAQAPFGNWDDPRQQDGCEEIASFMAIKWARGENMTLAEAEQTIVDVSDWEQENYGEFHDSSAQDTADRILRGYFSYDNVRVEHGISTEDIKRELYAGNLVLITVNGQKLGNPYFSGAGPERHMFPVIGYDPDTREFITNENGTKHGKNYRYGEGVLQNALQDYETGYKKPITEFRTAMIVVSK